MIGRIENIDNQHRLPLKHESSLLDWLQSSGRLISRDNVHEPDFSDEEEEISGLIDPDDVADIYEDDDDAEADVED